MGEGMMKCTAFGKPVSAGPVVFCGTSDTPFAGELRDPTPADRTLEDRRQTVEGRAAGRTKAADFPGRITTHRKPRMSAGVS